MRRIIALVLVAIGLVTAAPAQATSLPPKTVVAPGTTYRIPCHMANGKDVILTTARSYGTRELKLLGYYPGSEGSWVMYAGLAGRQWHMVVTSEDSSEGPAATYFHNDGKRSIVVQWMECYA